MSFSAEKMRIFRQGGLKSSPYSWSAGVGQIGLSGSNSKFFDPYTDRFSLIPSPANVPYISPKIINPVSGAFLGTTGNIQQFITPSRITGLTTILHFNNNLGAVDDSRFDLAQFESTVNTYAWVGRVGGYSVGTIRSYADRRIITRVTIRHRHVIEEGGGFFVIYYAPISGPNIGQVTVAKEEHIYGYDALFGTPYLWNQAFFDAANANPSYDLYSSITTSSTPPYISDAGFVPYGPDTGVTYDSGSQTTVINLPEFNEITGTFVDYGVFIHVGTINTRLRILARFPTYYQYSMRGSSEFQHSFNFEKIYADTGQPVGYDLPLLPE